MLEWWSFTDIGSVSERLGNNGSALMISDAR